MKSKLNALVTVLICLFCLQLASDSNGKASFNFYNTDQIGNYRIVIEGIDPDGT